MHQAGIHTDDQPGATQQGGQFVQVKRGRGDGGGGFGQSCRALAFNGVTGREDRGQSLLAKFLRERNPAGFVP